MIGAITGDIVGSIYEGRNIKTKEFSFFGGGCRFTDDTVCTVAVADCLIHDSDFADYLRQYVRRHPYRGYGGMFQEWASTDIGPYNSWGNGSAMRVSPVAHVARNQATLLEMAERSSAVTHNHPDAVAGAQAVALTMWMAMAGTDAHVIRREVADRFNYDLSRSVDEIRPDYSFDVSCAGTVPEAITCAWTLPARWVNVGGKGSILNEPTCRPSSPDADCGSQIATWANSFVLQLAPYRTAPDALN